MGRRNIDLLDPPPRRPRRGGARPPPSERGGASVRPRGRVPEDTRRQGRRGGLRGADRLRAAVVGDRARPARARPRHRGRNRRRPRRRAPALVRGADARPLRGADRGVRPRERRLAGDPGDRRERRPAAHGRFAPARGLARAGAEGGAVPELQPRRRRHGAPAGDERPDRTFRGVHELERRRGLRLLAALLRRLRHRHAGGGPRRALRMLRPVVPVEAAGLPLPAAGTYGGTASEAHAEAFLELLAVRRGRRLRRTRPSTEPRPAGRRGPSRRGCAAASSRPGTQRCAQVRRHRPDPLAPATQTGQSRQAATRARSAPRM